MKIQKDYSLLSHHTFGMNVKASLFIEYTSVEELKCILHEYMSDDVPWLHIGGGSNLLFRGDYSGMILHSAIKGYEVIHEDAETVVISTDTGTSSP